MNIILMEFSYQFPRTSHVFLNSQRLNKISSCIFQNLICLSRYVHCVSLCHCERRHYWKCIMMMPKSIFILEAIIIRFSHAMRDVHEHLIHSLLSSSRCGWRERVKCHKKIWSLHRIFIEHLLTFVSKKTTILI